MSDDKKYTDIDEIDDTELEEIEEDEDEYEEVCMMCHRPESKAGRMLHMPGNVCLCDDCMHRTMDMMNATIRTQTIFISAMALLMLLTFFRCSKNTISPPSVRLPQCCA